MTEVNFSLSLEDTNVIVDIIKIFIICLCTYYTAMKIMNITYKGKINTIFTFIGIISISVIYEILESRFGIFNSIICLASLITLVISIQTKKNIGYLILIVLISLSINYSLFLISIILSFLPNAILKINNDFISLFIIILIYMLLLINFIKIKKFKYGILFLQENMQNDYIDVLILNISVAILFSVIMLVNSNMKLTKGLAIGTIIFSSIMFVSIQKSLQLYYKQKLLVQELNETKEELENKKKEIEELEKENLNFSKTSHSLAHKQKALEFKINELMMKSEISEENDIKERFNSISKELYGKTTTINLEKTGITEIDDILEYMQSECSKSKIDFSLQLNGNIHSMINNIINKEDLEILLADHIKNAIIAINHSKNINKSILVKLGKIDNIYSIYIYDSGIEFERDTLKNLGKIPSTTHANEGGTGMGFMNTFDTLKKYNASLIINELNKPSKDNYTKVLIFKFDKNNEFKIISYREKIEK